MNLAILPGRILSQIFSGFPSALSSSSNEAFAAARTSSVNWLLEPNSWCGSSGLLTSTRLALSSSILWFICANSALTNSESSSSAERTVGFIAAICIDTCLASVSSAPSTTETTPILPPLCW